MMDKREAFEKEWAVAGMPKDKQRLVDAAWQACTAHHEAERKNLEQIIGAMYVIAGELLQANGQFDTAAGNKILDMLANLKYDDSVLPFVAKVSE